MHSYPNEKTTIVGAGIIGALTAYYTWLEARAKGEQARITVYDKNENILQTTACNIVPSLTDNEAASVVPPVTVLFDKLRTKFNEPGGIRVDDVKDISDSEVTRRFLTAVKECGKDEASHKARTKTLLELGKMSMQLWQEIYDTADPELKQILEEANFNPCREPRKTATTLHDGYRIDLIYNYSAARDSAEEIKADYAALGYKNCKILSPSEVMTLDPVLTEFCKSNTTLDRESKELSWNKDAIAIWRPGGCIDTQVFLPKFYAYLAKEMGQYTNEAGKLKDCFRLKFNRQVEGAIYSAVPAATSAPVIGASMAVAVDARKSPAAPPASSPISAPPAAPSSKRIMNGLKFAGRPTPKINKHVYKNSNYVICPGEAVGTLSKMGFVEPPYAGFAGASLKLTIPLTPDELVKYANFNHCMEVCQEGIVLAWQARIREGKLFIGVAGTKAYYADQVPLREHEFSEDRNIKQLDMINGVLPQFISIALGRNTKGCKLTAADLVELERRGIAERWVGRRAVRADGFVTVDHASVAKHPTKSEAKAENAIDTQVENCVVLTHFGSGGVSYGPAGAALGRSLFGKRVNAKVQPQLVDEVLRLASARV